MSQNLCWPFDAICKRGGGASAWYMLHGPLQTASQQARFAELRRSGARFVGMSSYLDFPRAQAGGAIDYEAVCEAWCHCFRQPDAYLPQAAPRALISVSDFTDWTWVNRAAAGGMSAGWYDLVYVGASEAWQQPSKNWPLAARCLPRLYRELGLRSLVIGRPDEVFPEQSGLSFRSRLAWPELLAQMAAARLLFVPNALDPSPRVIAEALCLDVPLLMHRHILGGWKYLNRFTGAFFEDEHDVVRACAGVLDASLRPRDWFRANYGPELAARRLTALLRPLDASLSRDESLRINAAGPPAHPAA